MNKIKRVSFVFRLMFQLIFFAFPLLLVTAWVKNPESLVILGGAIDMSFIPRPYTSLGSHGGILHELSSLDRLLGFCVSAIPAMVDLFIVYSLIQLFKLYEKGEIFSIQNVRYFRHIGFALLVGQFLSPVYECLMGLVLTWHNPPGHRFMTITLDQTNAGVVLIALLVILISWIMSEGCKLREEQQLTI